MTLNPFGPEMTSKTIPKNIGQNFTEDDRPVPYGRPGPPDGRTVARAGGLGDVTQSDSESYGEPQARRAVRLES